MNYIRLNNLSLKNQSFTPSRYKDKGISKFKFVAKLNFFPLMKQGKIKMYFEYLCESLKFIRKFFKILN